MNKQYGLKTQTGSWLPRDAQRRNNGERFLQPDMWQDGDRANELAIKYNCLRVSFTIEETK